MLSGAKHLQFLFENHEMQILRGVYNERENCRPFAEFTLSEANGLRVTAKGSG